MFFVWTLALLGLFLIFLEFFLPGAVMAIGGGILLLASLFFFHMENKAFFDFFIFFLSLIFLVFVVIAFALYRIKATAKNGTIYLEGDQEGFVASSYPEELVGKIGLADTDLKPSGHILVDGQRFHAVSKIGYIDRLTPIKILGGRGSHLIVVEHSSNT
jgi:membrane-bound ClpP family serine protease